MMQADEKTETVANPERPTDSISRHAALETVRDQVMASVTLPPEIRTIVQRHLTKALKGLWELLAA